MKRPSCSCRSEVDEGGIVIVWVCAENRGSLVFEVGAAVEEEYWLSGQIRCGWHPWASEMFHGGEMMEPLGECCC